MGTTPTTDLHFFRHGIAVDRGALECDDDSQRPLTPEGRAKMRAAAGGMKAFGLSFDWIFSSPYIRAKATAEIVADVLKLSRRVKLSEHLIPEGDPELLVEQLAALNRPRSSFLVVGHEPYLSGLIGTLMTGRRSIGLKLKKGGLARLTTDNLKFGRCAELEWLLTSRQIARLN